MKNPYLIQRCTIVGFKPNYKVSEFLRLDYMGSAEFEFGAMPRCLRRFGAAIDNKVLSIKQFDRILPNNESLTFSVLAATGEHDKWVERLGTYENYLKEHNTLATLLRGQTTFGEPRDDFWIDIENDVAATYKKGNLFNFMDAVKNSVAYMDEQKRIHDGAKV